MWSPSPLAVWLWLIIVTLVQAQLTNTVESFTTEVTTDYTTDNLSSPDGSTRDSSTTDSTPTLTKSTSTLTKSTSALPESTTSLAEVTTKTESTTRLAEVTTKTTDETTTLAETTPLTDGTPSTTRVTISASSTYSVTSQEISTDNGELCDCACNETLWILILGIGLGLPLLVFIIAFIVTVVELRKVKKELLGGSKYLTPVSGEISTKTDPRYVLQGPHSRPRSGIDSFPNVSYVDDNDFDEPLYTNQPDMMSADATTTFVSPDSELSDMQTMNVDITHQGRSEADDTTKADDLTGADDFDDLYVNKDVMGHLVANAYGQERRRDADDSDNVYVNNKDVKRHLVTKDHSPKRRIQTLDAGRDTYMNAGFVQSDVKQPGFVDTYNT